MSDATERENPLKGFARKYGLEASIDAVEGAKLAFEIGYNAGHTDASAGKPNRYETDKGGK